MRTLRLATSLGLVLLASCEEAVITAAPDPVPRPISVPNLLVSDPIADPSEGPSARSVVYVSLPPGALTDFASVQVSNFTTHGAPVGAAISNGGFDPIRIQASVGDQIRLVLSDFRGQGHVADAIVPPSAAPSIVRLDPAAGSMGVASDVRPQIVLSEPVDPAALTPSAVRLLKGGTTPIDGTVQSSAAEPWRIVFTPPAPVEPAVYEWVLGTLSDMDGEALATTGLLSFTVVGGVPGGRAPHPLALVGYRARGVSHIYVTTGDGSALNQLTEGYAPDWSPDGTQLVFTRNTGGPMATIWVVDREGTGERELASGQFPDWSPDGKKILLVKPTSINEMQAGELMIMNADGSGLTSLQPTDFGSCIPGPIYAPKWSPDGRRIAFGTSWQGFDPYDVCVMNADGTGVRSLTPGGEPGMLLSSPVWSPDGSRIAVSATLLDALPQGFAVLSYPVDTPGRREVHSSSPVWYEIGSARVRDWSPNGNELAVIRLVARNPGTTTGLRYGPFSLNPATGAFQKLVEDVEGLSIWDVRYAPVP